MEMRLGNSGMTCYSTQAVYYVVKDTLTSVPSPTHLVSQWTLPTHSDLHSALTLGAL